MKIGVVASSNGGVFGAVHELLAKVAPGQFEFSVVTDRPCGIEDLCDQHGVDRVRIEERDNREFSRRAHEALREKGGVEAVFLFFLRLVTAELFQTCPTYNVHPSLLPAYAGFNPVERMAREGSRYLGVTVHLVDESIDGGAIALQGACPVQPGLPLDAYLKISYLQKSYAILAFLEQLATGNVDVDPVRGIFSYRKETAPSPYFNPALANQVWVNAFREFEAARQGGISLCAGS